MKNSKMEKSVSVGVLLAKISSVVQKELENFDLRSASSKSKGELAIVARLSQTEKLASRGGRKQFGNVRTFQQQFHSGDVFLDDRNMKRVFSVVFRPSVLPARTFWAQLHDVPRQLDVRRTPVQKRQMQRLLSHCATLV